MAFGLAFDSITEQRWRRRIAGAFEIAGDGVARDPETARIAVRAQVAEQLVVENGEARAVVRQHDVPPDLAALDDARVADELLKLDVAIDTSVVEVYEVGSARLESASYPRAAGDQRSAREHDDVAPDVGVSELTASYDVESAVDSLAIQPRGAIGVSSVSVVVVIVIPPLRFGALTLNRDGGQKYGK